MSRFTGFCEQIWNMGEEKNLEYRFKFFEGIRLH